MPESKFYIPKPPQEVFASTQEDPTINILRENRTQFIIEKITYDKGILVWYKDTPYPRRGFPTPESVSAVNIVKHIFIEAVKTAGMWQFTLAWFISLFTRHGRVKVDQGPTVIDYGEPTAPAIEKLLASFNRICYPIISKYVLKPEFMTPLSSELQGLMFAFMVRVGISRDNAHTFCIIFGTLIEYDNAYRYRLEDIFSATTKEKLQANPKREISRLIKLYCSREKDWGVAVKFKTISRLTIVLFAIPKVKRALIRALNGCEFERLQLDDIDRYWCNVRNDYDFFGIPYPERVKSHTPVQGYQLVL